MLGEHGFAFHMWDDAQDWDKLIEGLRTGDPDTCRAFWNRYGALLEPIAARQMSARLQRRIGPDDIIQSVFRTFFRRMAGNLFDITDAGALWRLMCAITLTKARRAARDQSRLKRGLGYEIGFNEISPQELRDFPQPSDAPTEDPLWAVEIEDQLHVLLQELTEEQCRVLELRMNDLTNEQVAQELGCSERTVRRIVGSIESRWRAKFAELESTH